MPLRTATLLACALAVACGGATRAPQRAEVAELPAHGSPCEVEGDVAARGDVACACESGRYCGGTPITHERQDEIGARRSWICAPRLPPACDRIVRDEPCDAEGTVCPLRDCCGSTYVCERARWVHQIGECPP